MESPRRLARAAGFSYLITIVTGVFAEMFVRGRLLVRDDAAATAANIMTHETLYRLGLAADLVMLVAYVAVTFLLFILLQPVSHRLALLATMFSLVGIAVLAANSLNHIAPLVLLSSPSNAGLDATQAQHLGIIFLKLHARGYAISGIFFGTYCVLLGVLVYRAAFLPRILGVLLCAGGVGYLINSFAGLIAPKLVARLPDTTILGGISELALCVWLMTKGVDARKWEPCE